VNSDTNIKFYVSGKIMTKPFSTVFVAAVVVYDGYHSKLKCLLKSTGNFIVQTISVIVSTGGLFLLTFSTWQLTLDQPHCCSEANYSSLAMSHQFGISSSHQQSMANCSELNKVTFLEHLGFGISPALNIALAIVGLMVSITQL
jgi:hypothetical protein